MMKNPLTAAYSWRFPDGNLAHGIHDVDGIVWRPSRVDFELLVAPLPSRHGKEVLVNTSRHIIDRASSNFAVARLCTLARAGAEWGLQAGVRSDGGAEGVTRFACVIG
jgi:hypothetical protein